MKKERTWKFNIVDVVVILVIVAAGIFFALKFLHARPNSNANMITLRYEVEVPGMTRDMYEEVAALIPCRMAASVSASVMSSRWYLQSCTKSASGICTALGFDMANSSLMWRYAGVHARIITGCRHRRTGRIWTAGRGLTDRPLLPYDVCEILRLLPCT